MPQEQLGPMAIARGVRVDGENVVISVRGGNDAARKLCGELLLLMDQDADPIARRLAAKIADHWRDECMRLRKILEAQLAKSHDGKPCGECHLQPGERCDVCGALQGT